MSDELGQKRLKTKQIANDIQTYKIDIMGYNNTI